MFGLARVRASVSQFVNALYVSRLQGRGNVSNTLSVYIYIHTYVHTSTNVSICCESGNTTLILVNTYNVHLYGNSEMLYL